MTATTHAAIDSMTMLRRRLLHLRRYPSLTIILIGQPILFLVLFVNVFGGTLGAGLGGAQVGGGRAEYLTFLAPTIFVLAAASVAVGTSVSVAMDMTGGIIARFRTMAIAPSSVLSGHVLGAVVQSTLAITATGVVALLMGYRPEGGIGGWVGAVAFLTLFGLGLTWLAVAFGLASKSVESASNLPMILILLPFFGSGFVPTDSMPAGLRWFAEHQPFTPVIDTTRGLLDDTLRSSDAALAIAWSIAAIVLGVVLARRVYARERAQ